MASTQTLSKQRAVMSRPGTYETIFTNDDRIASQLASHSSTSQRHKISAKLFLSKTTDNLLKPYHNLKKKSITRSLSLHSPILETPESQPQSMCDPQSMGDISTDSHHLMYAVPIDVPLDDEGEHTHFDVRQIRAMRRSRSFTSNSSARHSAVPKSQTLDENIHLLAGS